MKKIIIIILIVALITLTAIFFVLKRTSQNITTTVPDGEVTSLNNSGNDVVPSNVLGDCIIASEKEFILNDTYIGSILNDIKLDISNLELGDYKYIIGKTKIFDKECDIVLMFSVTDIDEYENRMFSKQRVAFVSENRVLSSFDHKDGSSSIELGSFTSYKDYLIHVNGEFGSTRLAICIENNIIENVISGYKTLAKVEDGILKVSSYNAKVDTITERATYSKVYYKTIDENGKLRFEVDRIDSGDNYSSAET